MTITSTKAARSASNGASSAQRQSSTEPLFAGQSTTGDGIVSPGSMENRDDFVSQVVRIIEEESKALSAKALSPESLRAIDARIREEWGGDRPYIGRRLGDGRSERNEQIRREYRRGDGISLLCRRHEVSRSTVYRVIGVDDSHDTKIQRRESAGMQS